MNLDNKPEHDPSLSMLASWFKVSQHFQKPPDVHRSPDARPRAAGIYLCAKCGHKLFSSRSKYEHSSPWPAFTETLQEDSVSKFVERPGALKVSCGKCGNGLGHEFLNDGPKDGLSRF
ncbi:MSB1A reductase, partial [Atractosteus spatula]|nr:MSB1A reductase [Atractosteus spatula]